ncbi:hypothetical protein D3C72_1515260 [compost metagenome]
MVARRHAARDLEVDRLRCLALRRGKLHCDGAPFVARVGVVDLQLGQRALEARDVFIEAEGRAEVDGDHFVDAVAEDEAAVEDADLRVAQRGEFAVEKARRVGQCRGDVLHPQIMGGRHTRCRTVDEVSRYGGTPLGFTYNQWLCKILRGQTRGAFE